MVSEGFKTRLLGLLQIYQALRDLLDAETCLQIDVDVLENRRHYLNQVYDRFYQGFGSIAANAHLMVFEGMLDLRLSLLKPLEVGAGQRKADIFSTRTHYPEKSESGQLYFDADVDERLNQAIAKCLDETGGKLEIDRVAELCGVEVEEAEARLIDAGRIFREPILPEGKGHRTV